MIDFCNYKWTASMEGGRIIHPDEPWMWYNRDVVYVASDKKYALIDVLKRPKEIEHWDGKTYHPTVACGLLRSVDTFSYGTFSAEIQLPEGRNLWPAFWLIGNDEWPACGEIDIMEAWTNRFGGYYKISKPQFPYIIPLNYWDITTNIHWQEGYGKHRFTGSRMLPLLFSLKRPAHNFVKYEVEWRHDIITFRVNGKTIRTYGYDVAKHLHGKRMHVIFDLWTTGDDFACISPMKIRNFEYKPIETL